MDKIERTILQASKRIMVKANRLYPVTRGKDIHIVLKDLPSDFAALASFRVKTIFFDRGYCNQFLEAMVTEVVPHEIAHIVQDFVYPDAKYVHGKEWKEICMELGGIPRRLVYLA